MRFWHSVRRACLGADYKMDDYKSALVDEKSAGVFCHELISDISNTGKEV